MTGGTGYADTGIKPPCTHSYQWSYKFQCHGCFCWHLVAIRLSNCPAMEPIPSNSRKATQKSAKHDWDLRPFCQGSKQNSFSGCYKRLTVNESKSTYVFCFVSGIMLLAHLISNIRTTRRRIQPPPFYWLTASAKLEYTSSKTTTKRNHQDL